MSDNKRKSTPGPWKCKRLIDDAGEPYATHYEAHIDLGVCMVWAPPGNAEQEANAILLAAAPELADALRELHDFAAVDSFNRYEERSRAAFTRAGELLKRLWY